jgi:hypothetical protein
MAVVRWTTILYGIVLVRGVERVMHKVTAKIYLMGKNYGLVIYSINWLQTPI